MIWSENPKIEIFNTDCMPALEAMDENQFDLAIVDPPYGIGLDFQFKTGLGDSIHKKKQWNSATPSPIYFDLLHDISKDQIIWGANYYAKYIPAVGRIVHNKIMNQQGTKLAFSEADIASCSKQKRITLFNYRWNGNVQGKIINWNNTGKDGRIHPTQKPIALYEWLLMNYAKEGDTILDTHLGSGSIAIACYNLGFDLIGYEIDEDYYNAAYKRFKQQTAQTNMF